MSKPTLIQTLLNRPSQTYYNPAAHEQQLQRKDYHSAKQDMLRIAQAATAARNPGPSQHANINNLQFDSFTNSDYFTADTSPRSSLNMSGNLKIDQTTPTPTSRKPNRRDLNISTAAAVGYGGTIPSTRTPSSGSAGGRALRGTKGQRAIYTLSTHSSLSSTSLDGHSILSDYLTATGDSLEDIRAAGGTGAGGSGSTPGATGETGANLARSLSTSTRTSVRTARTTTTATATTATPMPSVRSTTTPISRSSKPTTSKSGAAAPITSPGAVAGAAHTRTSTSAKPKSPLAAGQTSKYMSNPVSGSSQKDKERPPSTTISPQTGKTPIPNGSAPLVNATSKGSHLLQKSTQSTSPTTTPERISVPMRNPSIDAKTKSRPSTAPTSTSESTSQKPKPFNAFAPMPVATRQAPPPPESMAKSKSGSRSQPTTTGIGSTSTTTYTTKQAQSTSPPSQPSANVNGNTLTNAKPPQDVSQANGTKHPKTQPMPKPIPSSDTNGHAGTSKSSTNGIPPRRQNQLPTSSKVPNGMLLMMKSMSAVMEEDEDYIDVIEGEGDGKQKKTLRHTTERGREKRRSAGPVQGLEGKGKEKEVLKTEEPEGSFKINLYRNSNSSISMSSASETQTPTNTRSPPLHKRRSRSLDSASSRPRLTQSPGQGHKTSPQMQTLSAEVQALTLASGGLPSIGTQGYSGLVLPRAPLPLAPSKGRGSGFLGNLPTLGLNLKPKFRSSSGVGHEGKIDLTRNGVARTTMASVEVVRGLAESSSGFGSRRGSMKLGRGGSWKVKDVVVGALGRRGSTSSGSEAPRIDLRHSEGKKPDVGNSVLGFTSYRSPPTYLPSRSVLVQVWAVGVDGVDGRLVGVKFGSPSALGTANEGMEKHERRDAGVEGQEAVDEERTGGSETEIAQDEAELVQDEDNPIVTQSTPFRTKNPFAALGRSLSLSLSLRKKHGDPGEDPLPTSKKGRSFSFRNKNGEKVDGGSSSISASPSKPLKLKPRTKAGAGSTTSNSMHVQVQTVRERLPSSSASHPSEERSKPGVARPQPQPQDSPPGPKRKPVPVPLPEPTTQLKRTKSKPRPKPRTPEVGYIPGRSFVGRVVEVGWELGEEVVKRGEWVVGLVDVRKSGALAEFIVVDRHRVHRVPHPRKAVPKDNPSAPGSPIWVGEEIFSIEEEQELVGLTGKVRPEKNKPMPPMPPSMLTLEELALLPLCGIPAYRAVRTFMYAFSGANDTSSFNQLLSPGQSQMQGRDPYPTRRRVLVLRGHDGAGAMAAQMLIQRGWRVSVHVPFSCVPANATQELADGFMRAVEDRARDWGADEVIFDDGEAEGHVAGDGNAAAAGDGDDGRAAAVRVMDTLREEGDVFDAVLDTVGGKEVREAGERLLRSNGLPFSPPVSPDANGVNGSAPLAAGTSKQKRYGIGQFTTLVGDTPERPVPSASDAVRANLRSFRLGLGDSGDVGAGTGSKSKSRSNTLDSTDTPIGTQQGKVGYAWISVAHEMSGWEAEDIGDTIGAVLRLAMEDGIRPLVEDAGGGILGRLRVVPFEQTPSVFVDNGPLADGGTVVVRVAG